MSANQEGKNNTDTNKEVMKTSTQQFVTDPHAAIGDIRLLEIQARERMWDVENEVVVEIE